MINPDEAPPGYVACAPQYDEGAKIPRCIGCDFFDAEKCRCRAQHDGGILCSPSSRQDKEWVILKVKL